MLVDTWWGREAAVFPAAAGVVAYQAGAVASGQLMPNPFPPVTWVITASGAITVHTYAPGRGAAGR